MLILQLALYNRVNNATNRNIKPLYSHTERNKQMKYPFFVLCYINTIYFEMCKNYKAAALRKYKKKKTRV